jgi:ABC-2 type transport system ATP-binding protein
MMESRRAHSWSDRVGRVEPAAPAALSVRNVSHSFGPRKALDGVDLEVPAGSFTALLGLNGAGKTTLFSLITRLHDSTAGSIRVLDFDVRRESAAALSKLGVVFQARTLDLDLSLRENLLYHAALHGIGRRAARAVAEQRLAQIGLADRGRDKVRNLSGGQMRRLEIARALLHEPRLLLLDEATVGLDVEARRAILAEVRRLINETGLGVLWATHLIDEIAPGDNLVVLHQGRVRARGPVEEVIARAGAGDLQDAFMRLVEAPASAEENTEQAP